MIELQDVRGMALPEAIGVLRDARTTRQVAEVQEAVTILGLYVKALVDLALLLVGVACRWS